MMTSKPSNRGPWRVDNTMVSRENARWTTSKSGRPCPCQNCSQGPPAKKDWNRISAELSLMSPQQPNQSRDWTELNWWWHKLAELLSLFDNAWLKCGDSKTACIIPGACSRLLIPAIEVLCSSAVFMSLCFCNLVSIASAILLFSYIAHLTCVKYSYNLHSQTTSTTTMVIATNLQRLHGICWKMRLSVSVCESWWSTQCEWRSDGTQVHALGVRPELRNKGEAHSGSWSVFGIIWLIQDSSF